MSTIPILRDHFTAIGERFASEDIIKEIDRIAPIAKADIEVLTEGDYDQADLNQLLGYRDTLHGESAERRTTRGAKKGARGNEATAIRAGKFTLRRGITMATSALSKRSIPADESPTVTIELSTSISAEIDALTGPIGLDSPKLRTRLLALRGVLTKPELAPSQAGKKTRDAFIAKIDAAIAALPALAETKKGLQAQAKLDTADLDEIDGRAYWNLKRLMKTGRDYWMERGEDQRAHAYTLTALHAKRSKLKPEEPKPEPKKDP